MEIKTFHDPIFWQIISESLANNYSQKSPYLTSKNYNNPLNIEWGTDFYETEQNILMSENIL